MQIHSIRIKHTLPVIMSVLLLGGCKFDNSGKLQTYMQEINAPQAALDSVLKATKRADPIQEAVVRQSTVDSMAFRELFNSTELANNSTAVADFNKIAARASLENTVPSKYSEHIYDNAVSDGITVGEANLLKKNLKSRKLTNYITQKKAAQTQSYSDFVAYKNFFKRHGLLQSPKSKESFNNTANTLVVL